MRPERCAARAGYEYGVWCTMEDDDAALIPAKQECLGVLEFARERLGFEPDAQQTAVLESLAKRGILNCTRQWGKSTVAGIKAIHRALRQGRIW